MRGGEVFNVTRVTSLHRYMGRRAGPAQYSVFSFQYSEPNGLALQHAVKVGFDILVARVLFGQRSRCFDFADRRMRGATFGGKGKQRDARTHPEELPGELRSGNGYVSELFHGWIRDDAAIAHEQH